MRKTSFERPSRKKKSGRDWELNKLGIVLIIIIIAIVGVGAYFFMNSNGNGSNTTPSKTAEFEISNLSITPSEINPGGTVNATAEVKNTGNKSGTKLIKFNIEGETKTVKVTLEPEESKEVSVPVIKEEPDSYEITVGGYSETFEVIKSPEFKSYPFENASLTYKMDALVLLEDTSGEFSIRMLDVTDDSYTARLQASGDIATIMKPETKTKDIEDTVLYTEEVNRGTIVGEETLDTELGIMNLVHYRFENQVEGGQENTEIWVEEETNIPVKMFFEAPTARASVGLIETNVKLLKSKGEE